MQQGSISNKGASVVTREDLIALLKGDLAREYQAIISNVVHSQAIKGPEYMRIAAELEQHAADELRHAMLIAAQIDYLGGSPITVPLPVKVGDAPQESLRANLELVIDTITHYRQRVSQCESLGEYAMAEHIRDILVQEQDHQVALAKALGIESPNATQPKKPLDEHSRINAGIA